jgi:hypothetical protein
MVALACRRRQHWFVALPVVDQFVVSNDHHDLGAGLDSGLFKREKPGSILISIVSIIRLSLRLNTNTD